MLTCPRCSGPLGKRIAFLCGNVFGDETIDSFFQCPQCSAHVLESYRDRFDSDASSSVSTLAPEQAAATLALVARCPTPGAKHCRCDANAAYFGT
jgi:hypothetical protein